jgi:DNA-3-methyladenine glycosylase II
MLKFITSEEDLEIGLHQLGQICPLMHNLIATLPRPPLRLREGGLEGLLRIIVFQQISISAGLAIWEKFLHNFPNRSPHILLEADDEAFKQSGLSRPKVKTIRALALAITQNRLTPQHLDVGDSDALNAISGIGPWSVTVYQLSCIGLADCFPAGDLALQVAIQHLFALETRPSAKECEILAARWQPLRAIAARMLWTSYTNIKSLKTEQIP